MNGDLGAWMHSRVDKWWMSKKVNDSGREGCRGARARGHDHSSHGRRGDVGVLAKPTVTVA